MTYETPVEGLDLFAGYSENFKAISATLLEVPGRILDLLEPETASNIDVGLQYSGDRFALGATWYTIDFENRIFYLGPQTPASSRLTRASSGRGAYGKTIVFGIFEVLPPSTVATPPLSRSNQTA